MTGEERSEDDNSATPEKCPRDGQSKEWHLAIGGQNTQGENRTNGEFMGCWFGVADAAWDARQKAIRECMTDLADAFGSSSQSWPQLIEMAELYAEVAKTRRLS